MSIIDIRIPLVADLRINLFSGAGITEKESGMTNGMAEEKGGIVYATQRPSIDVFEDAGTAGGGARGRAIQYWDENSAIYILNDGTLYKGTQGASISVSPSAGTTKCYFYEIADQLVLLDPENDEGWTINTSDTVTAISDADFPPNLGTPVGLAFGGAVLNNVLYVLGENGRIYGSDDGDPTSYNALNFIGATRDNDGGTYLGKHHTSIFAAGPSSIEFFEDTSNPTGSPLTRRGDIHHKTGISSGESVFENGDIVYFVGTNESGALAPHRLNNYQTEYISNPTIDSFLTQAVFRDSYKLTGSGFSAHGRTFYVLTLYKVTTNGDPALTLVYDQKSGLWGDWYATVNDISHLPIVGWTKRLGETERYGEGILMNGDLITINDNLVPQDTLDASSYVASGYVASGYVVAIGSDGTNIEFSARSGMFDGGVNRFKFPDSLAVTGDRTESSQTVTVKWSDENSKNFSSGRTLDLQEHGRLTRLGRFKKRNHEIEFSGTEQIRVEGIDLPSEVGER